MAGGSGIFANVEFDSIGFGGTITLSTAQLQVTEGSQIAATTFGFGDAGNVDVTAQSAELSGNGGGFPSGIFAAAELDAVGQGGNLTLNTNQLQVLDGAQVATSTFGFADAGNLTVQAEQITLSGATPDGRSGFFAVALEQNGNGGDLSVTADRLTIQNGAIVSVSTFPSGGFFLPGSGAAGNLDLTVQNLVLENQASITAETAAGNRGNIGIRTEVLVLRRNSTISTNATGTASGGNIAINAPNGFVVAVPTENSDITANAVLGSGGRVDIVAQGILGIQPRPQLTPLSDITASSEFGLSGDVTVNQLGDGVSSESAEIPQLTPMPNLVQGCQVAPASGQFINVGQGGCGLIPMPPWMLWRFRSISPRPRNGRTASLGLPLLNRLNPGQRLKL